MEDLKKIIGTFVKKDAQEILESTVINNTAIPGSIMVHRMYALINKSGYTIKNYAGINSYGDLLDRLKGNVSTTSVEGKRPAVQPVTATANESVSPIVDIGIDIEHIDNLPKTVDFREDAFYTSNFTEKEISYALLKANSYETFSGLFSAKEALCKVSKEIRALSFNEIEIEHSVEGKPLFNNFSLSISHANGFSIAVAVKGQVNANTSSGFITDQPENVPAPPKAEDGIYKAKKTNYILLALFISMVISLLLLFIILEKNFPPSFPHHF